MTIIVSDFDGTITKEDSLYNFFAKHASKNWLDVEKLWTEGKISSKECLIEEFKLVNGLSEQLIDKFIQDIEIDEGFVEFSRYCGENNIEFLVVSDGVDYFINKILEKNNIKGIKLVSNHAEFIKGEFKLTFPNSCEKCKNDSGTCKCKVVEDLKQKGNKILYIGDGTSDLCVSKRADYLFAKDKLAKYCEENKIKYNSYKNFKDILRYIKNN